LSGDSVFVGAAAEDVWVGEEEQPEHGFLRRRREGKRRRGGRKKEERVIGFLRDGGEERKDRTDMAVHKGTCECINRNRRRRRGGRRRGHTDTYHRRITRNVYLVK